MRELARLAAPPQDLAVLHINLARAASTATKWIDARDHLERARVLATTSAGSELVPRVEALAAQVAIGDARLEEAQRLAPAALSLAKREGLDKPGMAAAACEALEVLGRQARLHDVEEAQGLFSQAVAVAEAHDLPVWRLRALHELGTIDLFETWRVDRLLQARKLARREGALSTAAFVALNLAAVHVSRLDLEEALEFAEECAGVARCFGLGLLLPMALILQAAVHALATRRGDMEDAIVAALQFSTATRTWPAGRGGSAGPSSRSPSTNESVRSKSSTPPCVTYVSVMANPGRSGAPGPYCAQSSTSTATPRATSCAPRSRPFPE